jgi:seryl-tRNA synthetase
MSDPMPSLIKRGLVTQVGNGLFVFRGDVLRILEKIEDTVIRIAEEVGAEAIFVPSVLSWENTKDSQYLKSFANQALMIHPYQKKSPVGMASPTVCYHYISSLKGRVHSSNHSVTAKSSCTRRERGKLNDLSRLTNFTMREIISFGSPKYCLKKQEEIMNATRKNLRSVFDLQYEIIAASDPFFGKESELKKKAQIISRSKHEVHALIPFNKSSISIASANYHGGVFYDRFHIASDNKGGAASGCVGFGYERMLYAILAQKGVNFLSPYYRKLLA